MDRTWIYRNIHLIISLLLIRTYGIASKEYYCTKAGTWYEAMETCKRAGGVRLSYRDVYNSTAFTLKDSRTVWTADSLYAQYMKTTITIGNNKIRTCGTYVEEVKRYKKIDCKEKLESVCVFDDTLHDTATFSRTCFEEETTEEPGNVTRRPVWGNTNVTSADNRTYKVHKDNSDQTTDVTVNVTRWPFAGSTLITSADSYDNQTLTEHKDHSDQTTDVTVNVTRWPFAGSTIITSADSYDNQTLTEHKAQAGDSIAIVVSTIIVSLTICCILIGIGLFYYWKQRRQNITEKNTTVRYVNENLSVTSTGKNPSDTYGRVNDRASGVDIDDDNYEALGPSSGINSVDHVYTELNREYENVNSACRNVTRY